MILYDELVKEAKKHEVLYHYTPKESLDIIRKNKSLRLSRLDLVNDPDESKGIMELWRNKVYVACFTHSLDSEQYFIESYARGNGGRLIINALMLDKVKFYYDSECQREIPRIDRSDMKHREYMKETDWGIYASYLADIRYADDITPYIQTDNRHDVGLVKAKEGPDTDGGIQDWSIERETRLVVALRPRGKEFYFDSHRGKQYFVPPLNYIYISLDGILQKCHEIKQNSLIKCKNNEL